MPARIFSTLSFCFLLSCGPPELGAGPGDGKSLSSSPNTGVGKRVTESLNLAAEESTSKRNYRSAAVYYARLLEKDPDNVEYLVGLSRSLRMLDKPAEAKGYISKAMLKKENTRNPALMAELGKSQLALGDAMEAVESLSKSDSLAPGNWQTVLALAVAFDRISLPDQAERNYKKADELTPKNVNVLNNYALSKAQAGDFEAATKMLEEAASLPDSTPQVRQNLAMLYALQGKMDKAEVLVRRDLKPEMAEKNIAYYRDLRSSRQGGVPKEILRRLEGSRGSGQGPVQPLASGVELVAVESVYVALNDTPIRSAPSPTAGQVELLAKGLTVFVAGKTVAGDWAFVERDQRPVGYARLTDLRDLGIKPTASSTPAPAISGQPKPQIAAKQVEGKAPPPRPKNSLPQQKPKPVATTTGATAAKPADVPPPRSKPARVASADTGSAPTSSDNNQSASESTPAASAPVTTAAVTKPPKAPAKPRLRVGQTIRDCPECPELVITPAGRFKMGAAPNEPRRSQREMPQRQVFIPRRLAVGKYELTFAEWDACVAAGGCKRKASDQGWGRARRPAINVSWYDARDYVQWISEKTGKAYRLLSEAEWEYLARAGTATPYHSGAKITTAQARFKAVGSGGSSTAPVGQFPPNLFGLHDFHGNVREWTEDCRHENYKGAPTDGSAWVTGGDCKNRIVRGGSWGDRAAFLRSAYRSWTKPGNRSFAIGFRVARGLD